MDRNCGFNLYYDGSNCTDCLDGFYGFNCSEKCRRGFYGRRCSKKCECPADDCDVTTGCFTDSSTQVSTNGFKPYVTLDRKHSSNVFSTTDDALGTTSNTDHVPVLTSKIEINPGILIIATSIGGLIALFLFVIILQSCLKVYSRRKERVKQTSSKTDSGQEEDPYQLIEELINDGTSESNERQQQRKYYQLKNSTQSSKLPYQQIINQSHYQDIDETCPSSDTSGSSSNNSNTSYLPPKSNRTEKHSYLEIVDSCDSKVNAFAEGNQTDCVNQNDNDTSTQYLDPIQDVNLKVSENSSNNNVNEENGDYLDVTIETNL